MAKVIAGAYSLFMCPTGAYTIQVIQIIIRERLDKYHGNHLSRFLFPLSILDLNSLEKLKIM